MRRRRRKSKKSKGLSGFKFKWDRKTKQKVSSLVFTSFICLVGLTAFHIYQTPDTVPPKPKVAAKPIKKVQVTTVSKPKAVTLPPPRARKILTGKPVIVFVIDDIGHTREHEELIQKLGNRVTFAILPNLRHTKYFAKLAAQTGAEVILHQPLEGRDEIVPGPGLITQAMPDEQIQDVLNRNIQSIPNLVGVNNHMGSQGTADPRVMEIVLRDLRSKGLFFLDSYTTAETVSFPIAKKLHLPILKRDVFLDNVDDQDAIRQKVREQIEVARRTGRAIGIGHYRYNTLQVLNEEIPHLEAAGLEITSLMDLISQ